MGDHKELIQKQTRQSVRKTTERGNSASLPFDESEEVAQPSETLLSFGECLLALSCVKGLGRKSLVAIIDYMGEDLSWIWQLPKVEVKAKLFTLRKIINEKVIDATVEDRDNNLVAGGTLLEEFQKKNIHILKRSELPESLRTIADPPQWLFVQGNVKALFCRPMVAVVGTRNPTPLGIRATNFVIKQIAAYPIAIVSGLAEGIDEEAHRASLLENVVNVAFLGHGINHVFPAKTAQLRAQIIEKSGAVASEYLPDEHYQKHYFIERNRLQAALAQIVIPVEANARSGTAHTIRHARNYNRQIIGIQWKGANGILDELISQGFTIIDINNQNGYRSLDKIMRSLAEEAGQETYAFNLVQKRLLNEAKSRNIRRQDLEKLIRALTDVIETEPLETI
jgi:DNA protecting protein DprA